MRPIFTGSQLDPSDAIPKIVPPDVLMKSIPGVNINAEVRAPLVEIIKVKVDNKYFESFITY